MINRQIPHELQGTTEVVYELEGVRAHFVIPGKHIIADQTARQLDRTIDVEPVADVKPLSGLDILMVEDSLLIALDAEAMLQDAGAAAVEVASSAAAALAFLAARDCHVAVLDINLGRGTSLPVAEELTKRGIPFVFASGYNESGAIPERFRSVKIVGKPYSSEKLTNAISALLK